MSKRIIWIDNIRAIGCVLVILLHVSAYHLYKVKETSSFDWLFSDIVDSFTRVCVPLFFMISGFIFMKNKEVKFKNIFKLIANLILYSIISYVYLFY
ncbi:acyltransferase family protein, partial [Citrobacter sedlakii]|nr:acyltransferase family protein [Citrobacter sedlakii]